MLAEDYMGVADFAIIALLFPTILFFLSRYWRPDKYDPRGQTTYECGEVPIGDAQIQFHFQYYMYAIIFVAFDLKAHIGAALAMMGERARALSAFGKALQAIGYQNTGDYYQTSLRDAAGVLALMAEVQNAPAVNQATDKFVSLMKEAERMHTQEKAFVLMAAQAVLRAAGPVSLSRDGAAVADKSPVPRFSLTRAELEKGAIFANAGEGPVFASVSVYGSPSSAPAPAAQGFNLTKRLATYLHGSFYTSLYSRPDLLAGY